jgi:hypothetical protein
MSSLQSKLTKSGSFAVYLSVLLLTLDEIDISHANENFNIIAVVSSFRFGP